MYLLRGDCSSKHNFCTTQQQAVYDHDLMLAHLCVDPIGVEGSTCKSGTRKYIPLDTAPTSHERHARNRPTGPMAWSGARAIRIIRCLVHFIRNVANCGYGGATSDPTIVTAVTPARCIANATATQRYRSYLSLRYGNPWNSRVSRCSFGSQDDWMSFQGVGQDSCETSTGGQ